MSHLTSDNSSFAPPHVTTDRREALRYVASEDAGPLFTVTNGPDQIQARLRDLSTEGIGLIAKQPLPVGAVESIELISPSGRHSCRQTFRVVHATPWPSGGYLIGGTFLQTLTSEALLRLLWED